jgi:hypothetical protein
MNIKAPQDEEEGDNGIELPDNVERVGGAPIMNARIQDNGSGLL